MFALMLKQLNKAKHSGHIMGIQGSVREKNAYGLRILKILCGVQRRENRNIYKADTVRFEPWLENVQQYALEKYGLQIG